MFGEVYAPPQQKRGRRASARDEAVALRERRVEIGAVECLLSGGGVNLCAAQQPRGADPTFFEDTGDQRERRIERRKREIKRREC